MVTPTDVADASESSQPLSSVEQTDTVIDKQMAELDSILSGISQKDRLSAERSARDEADQNDFLASFEVVCQQRIRPALEMVLRRIEAGGGGGSIEVHPGGEARYSTPRMTLWLSLEGPIQGAPRPDLLPYLQFDAEVADREVRLSEGDMWRGAGGGQSGPVGAWKLDEISQPRVIAEVLAIVRRAAGVTPGD